MLTTRLPINFSPKNEFQDFSLKTIVHELAHEHAEVYLYLPCPVNFENKAAIQIFESLFLLYGGVLYDRLRDELGLVYGLQSSFLQDLQVCQIYLSCEIKYIETILAETKKVFGDFEQYFRADKFADFKKIIRKKQDLAQDTLGASNNFTVNMLRTYGIPEKYSDYTARLDAVSAEDVRKIYDFIKENWPNKKVVIVSKKEEIKNLNLEKI